MPIKCDKNLQDRMKQTSVKQEQRYKNYELVPYVESKGTFDGQRFVTEKTFYLMQQAQVRVQIFLRGLLVQCLQTTFNITVNI
jgi:hypothetical protein